MRLLHHGELIRDAGHCESIGCHILAGWKAVYEDKTYSYLCDHHMTTLAQTTRRARGGEREARIAEHHKLAAEISDTLGDVFES